LDFAEFEFNAAGQRTFNVNINGTQVLTNFDIFATAGGANKAVARQFTARADASGQITITFTNSSSALINAIQVLAGGTVVQAINCGVTGGSTINISAATFQNQGQLQVSNGETMNVSGLTGNLSNVALSGASSLTLNGSNYVVNQGLTVGAGQTVTLNGTWSNTVGSTLAVAGGTFKLGGSFTPAGLGTFSRRGGTVNVSGPLANTRAAPGPDAA